MEVIKLFARIRFSTVDFKSLPHFSQSPASLLRVGKFGVLALRSSYKLKPFVMSQNATPSNGESGGIFAIVNVL
jgi:hypothetical protein